MSQSSSPPGELDSFARFTRRLVLVVLVIASAALLWSAPQTPFLLLAAILFALLLDAGASLLRRATGERLPRGPALALAMAILVGLGAGGVAFIGPQVSEQATMIREQLPRAIGELEAKLDEFALGRVLVRHAPSPSEVDAALNGTSPEESEFAKPAPGGGVLKAEPAGSPSNAGDGAPKAGPSETEDSGGIDVGAIFTSTFGALIDLLVILIIGIYLAISPSSYLDGAMRLVPVDRRDTARETLTELETLLKRWLAGRLFSMAVVGVLTAGSLSIVGVPFALTLGLLAGLLSFIPNLGPVLAMIPGMLLALLEGGTELALIAGACYVVVQFVESYLITPLVEKHAVSLPPALLIFMQLVVGVLFGGLGLILATPLTVIGIVLVRRVYIEGFLGDDMEDAVETPG